MRALIDTCIIIDALQGRLPFADVAEKIIVSAANKQFEGYITAKASTDIYYLTHRYTHSDKESREVLNKIYKLFHILDTTALDCQNALSSPMSDYEDAIMVETSLRSEMNCIVTRNLRDYTKSPVKVYDPDTFLSLIQINGETA